MHIVVWGVGGVGGNFGARLYAGFQRNMSSHTLQFLSRGDNFAVIKQNGLLENSPETQFQVPAKYFFDNPKLLQPADVVILCVKAWQILDAAEEIAKVLKPDALVLPLQNTIESTSLLKTFIPPRNIISGLCYTTAFIESPGCIRVQAGALESIIFGEINNERTERVEHLLSIIDSGIGLHGEVPVNIHHRVWKKFVWISSVGAVGAYTGKAVGMWRDQSESRGLFLMLLREAMLLANLEGAELSDDDFESIVQFLDSRPAGFTTSMQRDHLEGRRSELDFQLGSLLRLARSSGIEASMTEMIYTQLSKSINS